MVHISAMNIRVSISWLYTIYLICTFTLVFTYQSNGNIDNFFVDIDSISAFIFLL